MKYFLIIFLSLNLFANQLKVALIDTGLNLTDIRFQKHLCKNGHTDFVKNTSINDVHGHGSHLFGLIQQYAEDADYCVVVLKFYNTKEENEDGQQAVIDSYKKAIDLKVDVINLSLGGVNFNAEECLLMKKALDQGITIIAAAGNEGSDISKQPYYPATCDKRIIVVQNYIDKTQCNPSSNFGPNLEIEIGTTVLSTLPDNSVGYMSGTSQAAAIRTGKIIKQLDLKRRHNGTK